MDPCPSPPPSMFSSGCSASLKSSSDPEILNCIILYTSEILPEGIRPCLHYVVHTNLGHQ